MNWAISLTDASPSIFTMQQIIVFYHVLRLERKTHNRPKMSSREVESVKTVRVLKNSYLCVHTQSPSEAKDFLLVEDL